MEKLIRKFTKGEKVDYEAEMVADYDEVELNEHNTNTNTI
jgi:HAE1 family hydrophobic/amphiphilic exporter-1